MTSHRSFLGFLLTFRHSPFRRVTGTNLRKQAFYKVEIYTHAALVGVEVTRYIAFAPRRGLNSTNLVASNAPNHFRKVPIEFPWWRWSCSPWPPSCSSSRAKWTHWLRSSPSRSCWRTRASSTPTSPWPWRTTCSAGATSASGSKRASSGHRWGSRTRTSRCPAPTEPSRTRRAWPVTLTSFSRSECMIRQQPHVTRARAVPQSLQWPLPMNTAQSEVPKATIPTRNCWRVVNQQSQTQAVFLARVKHTRNLLHCQWQCFSDSASLMQKVVKCDLCKQQIQRPTVCQPWRFFL